MLWQPATCGPREERQSGAHSRASSAQIEVVHDMLQKGSEGDDPEEISPTIYHRHVANPTFSHQSRGLGHRRRFEDRVDGTGHGLACGQ
jgi:hypothetical protein